MERSPSTLNSVMWTQVICVLHKHLLCLADQGVCFQFQAAVSHTQVHFLWICMHSGVGYVHPSNGKRTAGFKTLVQISQQYNNHGAPTMTNVSHTLQFLFPMYYLTWLLKYIEFKYRTVLHHNCWHLPFLQQWQAHHMWLRPSSL